MIELSNQVLDLPLAIYFCWQTILDRQDIQGSPAFNSWLLKIITSWHHQVRSKFYRYLCLFHWSDNLRLAIFSIPLTSLWIEYIYLRTAIYNYWFHLDIDQTYYLLYFTFPVDSMRCPLYRLLFHRSVHFKI